MQQLIYWSKNLAVLHFKQILLKVLGESGSWFIARARECLDDMHQFMVLVLI